MMTAFKINLLFVCLFFSSGNLIAQLAITSAEYTEFLNKNATSDPDHFYDEKMATDLGSACIKRTGAPGSYRYEAEQEAKGGRLRAGGEDRNQATDCRLQATGAEKNTASFPVIFLNYNDAVAFAHWKGQRDARSFSLQPSAFSLSSLRDEIDLELKTNQLHFTLFDGGLIQAASTPGVFDLALGEEERLIAMICSVAGGIFGTANSLEVNQHRITDEQQKTIETGLQAAATRDDEVRYHEETDALWKQSQTARNERTATWDELEKQEERCRRAQALVAEEEAKLAQKDSNKNFLATTAEVLQTGGVAVGSILEPHSQIAAPALYLLGGGVKGINSFFTNRPLYWAKAVEEVTAEEAANVQERCQIAQSNAPDLESEAQAAEESFREKEKTKTYQLALDLKPPIESVDKNDWESWAARIINLSKGKLDSSWEDKIAAKGLADPIWASKIAAAAWVQRMETSGVVQNQLTPEMETFKEMKSELEASFEQLKNHVDAHNANIQKKQNAEEAQAQASILLKQVNKELCKLEAKIELEEVADSISEKRKKKNSDIGSAQSASDRCSDEYQYWNKECNSGTSKTNELKNKSLEDLRRYLDLEEIVLRQYERAKAAAESDRAAWRAIWPEEDAWKDAKAAHEHAKKESDAAQIAAKAVVPSLAHARKVDAWQKVFLAGEGAHRAWTEAMQKTEAAFVLSPPFFENHQEFQQILKSVKDQEKNWGKAVQKCKKMWQKKSLQWPLKDFQDLEQQIVAQEKIINTMILPRGMLADGLRWLMGRQRYYPALDRRIDQTAEIITTARLLFRKACEIGLNESEMSELRKKINWSSIYADHAEWEALRRALKKYSTDDEPPFNWEGLQQKLKEWREARGSYNKARREQEEAPVKRQDYNEAVDIINRLPDEIRKRAAAEFQKTRRWEPDDEQAAANKDDQEHSSYMHAMEDAIVEAITQPGGSRLSATKLGKYVEKKSELVAATAEGEQVKQEYARQLEVLKQQLPGARNLENFSGKSDSSTNPSESQQQINNNVSELIPAIKSALGGERKQKGETFSQEIQEADRFVIQSEKDYKEKCQKRDAQEKQDTRYSFWIFPYVEESEQLRALNDEVKHVKGVLKADEENVAALVKAQRNFNDQAAKKLQSLAGLEKTMPGLEAKRTQLKTQTNQIQGECAALREALIRPIKAEGDDHFSFDQMQQYGEGTLTGYTDEGLQQKMADATQALQGVEDKIEDLGVSKKSISDFADRVPADQLLSRFTKGLCETGNAIFNNIASHLTSPPPAAATLESETAQESDHTKHEESLK